MADAAEVAGKRRVRALLLDLEGTVYFKGRLIAGAARAVGEFRERGFLLRFLTNTDSKTARTIAGEVREMGLQVAEEEVFTPARAVLQFFRQHPGARCHCLLSRELGVEFAPFTGGEGPVDYVVVGDFRQSVSYDVLNAAFRHIMAGAEIIALQKGRYFVRAEGVNLDTGAFVQLFEYASGKLATVLGKPAPGFFNMCLDELKVRAEEAAVVGDDVSTDIVGAGNIGAWAVLVRTGKFSAGALDGSPQKPDLVLDSLADLPEYVEAAQG